MILILLLSWFSPLLQVCSAAFAPASAMAAMNAHHCCPHTATDMDAQRQAREAACALSCAVMSSAEQLVHQASTLSSGSPDELENAPLSRPLLILARAPLSPPPAPYPVHQPRHSTLVENACLLLI